MGGGYFRRTVNKKVIVPLIGIITLIILVVGISYAAFTYSGIGEKENVITTANISMVYNEGQNGITLENAIPMEDEIGKKLTDENQVFDFTVSINIIGKTTIAYEVTAEKQEESTLQNNEVRIYLEKSTDNTNYNEVAEVSGYEPLEEDDSFGAKEGEMVLDTGSASKKITYYYKLRMWVSKEYQLGREAKKFTIKVNVYGSDGVTVNVKEHFNEPQLVGDMIPVVWDESSNKWKKADKTKKDWYDYDNQKWANAVTIKSDKREEYKSAEVGKEIDLEDVNLMLVWIPRYSYTLRDQYGYKIDDTASEPSQATPGAFDIKFVSTDTIEMGSGKYSGEKAENYFTPSSFCWGDTCDDEATRNDEENRELPGIWISKFELTGDIGNITSVPNQASLTNQSISSFFNAIKNQMNGESGKETYGFSGNNYDIHLSKNTEWGAMAYLSQSKYGKYGNKDYQNANKEIYINDYYNNGTLTGCSKGAPGSGNSDISNTSSTCEYAYDVNINGTGASTTGTIYGIYDTSGGSVERAMGTEANVIANTEFSQLPEKRYYNLYANRTGIKGDATNIDGTANFYQDRETLASASAYIWFGRGGYYAEKELAGIFAFSSSMGAASYFQGARLSFSIFN